MGAFSTSETGQRRAERENRLRSSPHREDPLPDGQPGEHLVGEIGGHLGHAPCVAGGADAATLATEGDEPLVAAGVTASAGKAVSQDPAAEVGSEIALDPGRDAATHGNLVLGRSEEGLQVVLNDGVEGRVPLRLWWACLPPPGARDPMTRKMSVQFIAHAGQATMTMRPRTTVLTAALIALSGGQARAQQAGLTLPVVENGQAQVVPALQDSSAWIREELWVEAAFDSDGDGAHDRLHVAVVRPRQAETDGVKVPVIYESSPYFAGTAGISDYFWPVRQEVGGEVPERNPAPPAQQRAQPGISSSLVAEWVPRGFAVVHSSAPGTGLSQGCPTVGGPVESQAPKAVIDWLNGRARGFTSVDDGEEVVADWTTGRVGMTGTSYNGTLPVAAASTGVEGLEAIIPVAPNTSYYRYYRSNGLVRNPGGYPGEDVDVLYDFVNSGDPSRRAWCDANVRDGEMRAGHDRVTGDYNDFWATRDLQSELEDVQAATLMAHAFNDWNVMPEHSVRVYEYLKGRGVPVQAYFHQGGHGGPPPMELMNRWFTRYLWGVENGVENDPRAWIVRGDDDRQSPTPYADYPNPDAAPVTLHPTAGGVQAGGLGITPGLGTETLVDNFSFDGATLARAEWTEHRLLYTTPELADDVHISGTPRVTVRLASSAPAANLSVWVVSLPWTEGRSARGGVITRGWADPQNHASLSESEPLVPGRFYDVTFDLQPDDQVIPAGQRIGLMIMSTDREFTLLPDPGTELTVDLGGTWLELPVVGGQAAVERARRGGA
jgi:X-Pro dipeptidyl-peptidase